MITRQRIIDTLEWMVEDMKHRSDECRNNFEEGSNGGYSPELKEAINLLDELKEPKVNQDKEMFCHVCFAILMQHGTAGILIKSPKYIKEKIQLTKNPLAAWQGLDYANRALLLTWADSWNVPVRDWIKEIGGEI